MAYDKVVDSSALDANLLSIAEAIRTKGGSSGALAFPEGFVEAIEALSAGADSVMTGTVTLSSNASTLQVVHNAGKKPKSVYVMKYSPWTAGCASEFWMDVRMCGQLDMTPLMWIDKASAESNSGRSVAVVGCYADGTSASASMGAILFAGSNNAFVLQAPAGCPFCAGGYLWVIVV